MRGYFEVRIYKEEAPARRRRSAKSRQRYAWSSTTLFDHNTGGHGLAYIIQPRCLRPGFYSCSYMVLATYGVQGILHPMTWIVEFDRFPQAVQDELFAQAKVIEQFGPAAKRPRVDTLNGSAHANMKELRFEVDMARTLDQKISELPAKRRARIMARATELVAEELSLRDLRKAMNRTQVEMAKTLKVGQDTVSRYEQRTDMLLSTLQDYVQAMGGELDLVAKFPNRQPVRIKALRDLANDTRSRRAG